MTNSFFSKFSLKIKLLSSFGIVATLLGVVGFVGYYGIMKEGRQIDVLTDHVAPTQVSLAEIKAAATDVVYELAQRSFLSNDQRELDRLAGRVSESIKAVESEIFAIEHRPNIAGEEGVAKDLNAAWATFKEEVISLGKTTATANPKTGKIDAAHSALIEEKFATTFQTSRKALFAKVDDYTTLYKRYMEATMQESDRQTILLTRSSLAMSILGIFFAFAMGTMLALSLTRQLDQVSGMLQGESTGLKDTSNTLAEAATQLSTAIEEQAAALQETASAVDEVNSMVKKNSENAEFSQKVSKETSGQTANGKQVVSSVITSMNEITDANVQIENQVKKSNEELSEIVKVIGEISSKTKVIHDIVFQTKLLSFNASVEAARAGEHGKGFAVVAEEVGNLAQMSGKAAKEISEILENSLHKVEQVVNETKTKVGELVVSAKGCIERGVGNTQRCDEVFGDLSGNVSKVDRAVEEIATASREQAQGVNEISKAISQLEVVTQQNARSARETESSASRVRENSSRLQDVVESLMATVHGSGQRRAIQSDKQLLSAPPSKLKKASPPTHASAPTPGKAAPRSANVVPMEKFRKSESTVASAPARSKATSSSKVFAKAVGAENVPSADDKRFEDI